MRAITRLEGPHPDVDAALVVLAQAGTVTLDDLELEELLAALQAVMDHGRSSADDSPTPGAAGNEAGPPPIWQQRLDARPTVTVRDGGTCRFPGCTNHIGDIHHLDWWSRGGPTDIENGLLLCRRHHTMAHHGYRATGNANGEVTFHRPDDTVIGITRPRVRRWRHV